MKMFFSQKRQAERVAKKGNHDVIDCLPENLKSEPKGKQMQYRQKNKSWAVDITGAVVNARNEKYNELLEKFNG